MWTGIFCLLSVHSALQAPPSCPLHETRMKLELVPIVYGTVFHCTNPDHARRRAPNAGLVIEGGCVIRSPRIAATWACDACRVALTAPQDDGPELPLVAFTVEP